MKRIILLIVFYIFSFQVSAQQIVREWVYKSGNSDRTFASNSLTSNGNVILAGSYGANPTYQTIYMLVKPNLDTIWVKNGFLNAGRAFGILQTPDNGFAFYGTQKYTNPNATGPSLQKLDANGNIKWTKQYATGYWESGEKLLLAPGSGYFFGGTNQVANIPKAFTLNRTDSLGNLKWRKHFNWHLNDFLADIQHTRNGNIIMYGYTGAPQRLKLLLVNQNGDSVLGRKITIIGDPNRHERMMFNGCIIIPLSDNGFLMAAEIDTVNGQMLGMVVKVNANLQPQWHYIHRTLPNNVVFIKAKELTDSSVVVLGFNRQVTTGTQNNQFFLYHFSKRGTLQNIYPFTSTVGSQIRPLILQALPDSSFIIGGRAATTAQFFPLAFYLAKVKIPGLPPAMPAPAIVSGTKPGYSTAEINLGQSYPNPTASEAIIPYALPKNYSNASILIRDIATGRAIGKYQLKRNSRSLTVDVSNLSSGLYLYSLVVDEKPVATKKLAVMK
ncbi:T9SS type A sorting domain-containing protein [Adhaeribacter sp. BT258]|uniref:T9SS type A sorting domain-containing protein n=1 Tax=Adhaeribacter terrigena TaxID=2793070 RepID=A0ABS1C4F8_9BACT|nr:T9SS type A sorting domain-containing protein [Adhaeribacter terrigena]MBK0404290.1 T9SS type A sorting domain-containing protein [Adhaeribacter terrigena]